MSKSKVIHHNNFHLALRRLKIKSLDLYSYFKSRINRTSHRRRSAHSGSLGGYISFLRNWRRAARISAFLLTLTIMAILFPISFKSATPVEGIAKDPNPSTLSFTASSSSASASLSVTNTAGSTATSNTNVAFTLSTNNATGYTLRLKTTGGDTLVDSTNSNTSTNHIDPIGTDGITLDQFSNNTWGLLPSKYNGANNTTNYYKPTTTGFKMDETQAPNTSSNANSYTVGLGIKADYTRPAGTYTNTTIVAEYVANAVSYAIYYNSNTTATVSGMPSLNPQSGTVQDPTVAQNVTLASAPTRNGYTFSGWCLGTSASSNITTTNGVDTCNSTKYDAGQQFGINAVDGTSNANYNDTYYLYAMWTGNEYTATIYYNNKTSSGTSGATPSITSNNTAKCRVTSVDGANCTIQEANIPDAVKNSVGQYNNTYAGLATTTGTMSSNTSVTLTGNTTFYAVYRTTVTLYKPSSISAATTVTLYRNQWLSSTSAMADTVLSNSTTGISNWTYTRVAAVSGTNPAFSLYGFNTATNSASRVSTCGAEATTACSTVARLATSAHTTVYSVERVSIKANFYYNNNTTTDSCTTAAVTSTTGSAYRYLYTTSATAVAIKDNKITVPTDVSSSKGTCGMTYKNVGTSTGNMTAATPNTSGATGSNTTVSSTYYARYSGPITNYYYTSSAYTSRTIYRNQRVNGTSASSMSAIVLSTSATGTSNYSTATGPGSSVWTGLATSATTTVAYSTVANAATASTAYSNLYTIYQFNITYSTTGSTGVSGIGSTSGSCKVTTSSTSCTVTLPAINVQSGYESLGWGTQGHTSAGTAAGSSYTLSSTGTTLYANAKVAKTYMQNLTSSTIATLLPSVGSTATVYDSRDENPYTIAKLADNKYWMVSNLNLAGGTTISCDTSDCEKYTIPTNQGWQSGGKLPASSTSGFSSDNYAYVYNSGSTTCGDGSPCYSYYSWDAATLGSGRSISTNNTNAPYSICPKGWKLPTTRNGIDSTTDFRALMIALGGSSSVQTYTSSTSPTGATMYGKLTASPYNFLLAGYYYNGSFYYGGSYGYYWSAASYSSSVAARDFYFDSTNVYSANDYYRRSGFSVRCVFGG